MKEKDASRGGETQAARLRASVVAAVWGALVGPPRMVVRVFRRAARLWRRSLYVRVVAATLALSVVVVALVGFVLLDLVRGGLLRNKTSSSVVQAEAGFTGTQQFFADARTQAANGELNATADTAQLLTQAVDRLCTGGAGSNQTSAFYQILLLPPGWGSGGGPYSLDPRSCGGVQTDTIPADLSRAVAADAQIHYRPVLIDYQDQDTGSRSTDAGLAVGTTLSVPGNLSFQLYYLFPFDQERATLNLLGQTIAGIGGLLVLLLAAVAAVITRQVVTPVRMAARTSERLAAGVLGERMRVRGEDDLARLAGSFNKMADSLQRQIRQLEELSRVQRRFTSDVSHELRTPLTTVRMAADVLHEARDEFDPAVARSAELLQAQLDRFEALLTDLLEISRFDAGAAVLDEEPVDLRDLVRRVVEAAEPLAESRNGRIVVVAPEERCVAEVDPRRIERVLRNLVVNAVEYGEGRDVVVRVATSDDAVAVAVRDHGVGLKPGESSLVFSRFWRADPARARKTGGTGLGLSIALEDARLHHGWLQAWGEPGNGAQFRLTVPKRAGSELVSSPLPLEPEDARSGQPREHHPSGGGPLDGAPVTSGRAPRAESAASARGPLGERDA